MADDALLYKIAVTFLPSVGAINAKQLIAYCGSAKEVFSQKESALQKIPGIGKSTAANIKKAAPLKRAEHELNFVTKNNIETLYFLDANYPARLKHCADAPIILYKKGNGNTNPHHALAVVGTRNATQHGKELTQNFITDSKAFNCQIISGLAYGIDITAHKSCVDHGISTFGILAHGLDRIYPALHEKIANQMMDHGGLITEFPSGSKPDRENFPKRNRIIAGMADATVVVEAAAKGGALITAEIAASYNRDVFAFPGRPSDRYSEGCNKLIFSNQAALIRNAQDLAHYFNWQPQEEKQPQQTQAALFVELSKTEEPLANILRKHGKAEIETLCHQAEMPISKVVSMLFQLELKGAVRAHPGKVYEWIGGL